MVNINFLINRKFVFGVIFFLCLLTSCSPHSINPDVINLNESCNIYNGDELLATVSYDDFYSEKMSDQGNLALIVETLTITPMKTIRLLTNDFLLAPMYENYSNDDEKYKSSIEYNIEKNQYDIFENEIS